MKVWVPVKVFGGDECPWYRWDCRSDESEDDAKEILCDKDGMLYDEESWHDNYWQNGWRIAEFTEGEGK